MLSNTQDIESIGIGVYAQLHGGNPSVSSNTLSGSFEFSDDDSIVINEDVLESKYETMDSIRMKREMQGLDSSTITEFDVMRENMLGIHSERFNKLLSNMPPADFIKAFPVLLQYILPKLKSIDYAPASQEDTVIDVVYHDSVSQENNDKNTTEI